MSDYLNTYTVNAECSFQESFLEDEYLSSVFKFAVSNAIDAFGSYWSSEPAQDIIKEDTFCYIWNSFPEKRGELLSIAISTASGTNYSNRIKSLTGDFCRGFLENMYSDTPVDDKLDTNRLRARLVSVVDKNFDYLSELHKFSLIEDDQDLFSLWENIALQSSYDEGLYDYLWSQVKRERGATDKKQRIVSEAIKKNVLSDALTAKIAKSSPKRLKRVVVRGISDAITAQTRLLRKAESSFETTTPAQIDLIKENIAKLESRAMLYVGCNDHEVVESLMTCLSRDNLPWLLPSASEHYWLSQRISRLIDEGEQD